MKDIYRKNNAPQAKRERGRVCEVAPLFLKKKGVEEKKLAYLNGVDIVSNKNKLGLLLLDEGSNVVDSVLENGGRSRGLGLGVLELGLGQGGQTLLLLELGLRLVLVGEGKQAAGGVLVDGLVELLDNRGDLQTGLEHTLLALHLDVTRPLDKVGQITLERHAAADGHLPGALDEQGVMDLGLLGGRGLLFGGFDLLLGLGGIVGSELGGLLGNTCFRHVEA